MSLKAQIIVDTLSKAKGIPSELDRIHALAMLAPHLPEPMSAEAALFCSQAIEHDNYCSEFLAECYHNLPEFLQNHVLNAIQAIPEEEMQTHALIQIIPHLTKKSKQDVLQIASKFQVDRNRTLLKLELAELLSEQERREILKSALEEVRVLHHGRFDWRERLPKLKRLVPKLTTLSCMPLYDLWMGTLHFLTSRNRSNLLADLGALSPLIFKLGGTKAAENAFYVVTDVGRQW